MKQSRSTSLLKSLVSTGVGFGVAYAANMIILPLFGLPLSHSANLLLTTIYTVISIARGYALERVFEAMGWRMKISPFMQAVIAERQRQQDVEGWDKAHDDRHDIGELARAGASYAISAAGTFTTTAMREHLQTARKWIWPWENEWWKPTGFRRDLVKAGALIVAEGEKFDRSRKRKPVVTDDRSSDLSRRLESKKGNSMIVALIITASITFALSLAAVIALGMHARGALRVGKKAAGRLLGGKEHNGFPELKSAERSAA